jgi:hypothetical protein
MVPSTFQIEVVKVMKLSNFEEYVEDTILDRGLDYFRAGRVLAIEAAEEDLYIAKVEGSEDYTVEITLVNEDEIAGSFCDCPYDWGDFCKHEAAVFYALREQTGKGVKPQKSKKATVVKKRDLKTILSNQSKSELISIILELANEYKGIENRIQLQYTSGPDEISTAKKLIREYISKAKRRGFIEWGDVDLAVQGAQQTLHKARGKVDSGDTESAILLSITVLSIVVDMLQYCDDSNGTVGSVIDNSVDLISIAANVSKGQMTFTEQKKLFTLIMKEAMDKRYDGWDDWRFDLLKACIYFCEIEDLRIAFERQLESMSEELPDHEWSREYYVIQLKKLKLELIERYDQGEQAEIFIEENIHHSFFREKAILSAFEKRDYHRVIQLCLEGEEINKAFSGLVARWKEYRYQAYEKLSETGKQRELALELLYENNHNYYIKLKNLYQPDEWQESLEKILSHFEKQDNLPSVYEQILIKENLTVRLLTYCKRYTKKIIHLYPYLIKEFPAEVNEFFVTFIEDSSKTAANRRDYKKICGLIKSYKKACGNTNAVNLIAELKQNYKKRPAFVDELEKFK